MAIVLACEEFKTDCFNEDWVVNWFLDPSLGLNMAEALKAASPVPEESWWPGIPAYPCLTSALWFGLLKADVPREMAPRSPPVSSFNLSPRLPRPPLLLLPWFNMLNSGFKKFDWFHCISYMELTLLHLSTSGVSWGCPLGKRLSFLFARSSFLADEKAAPGFEKRAFKEEACSSEFFAPCWKLSASIKLSPSLLYEWFVL